MKNLSRVVWSEGMYLGPHHFQAQNRYFEDAVHFATSAVWFEPYGLIGYELDAEALRNGTVALVHARGIFPDGLGFHMPEYDPLPAPRPIADQLHPMRDALEISLAIAPHRPDGLNCDTNGDPTGPLVRYVSHPSTLADENTGRDAKPIQLGRKNIRFLLDTEDAADAVTLPLARVRREGTGQFLYDPAFIPPCLQISAAEPLLLLLRRLIELLEDKCRTMARPKDLAVAAASGFSAEGIANAWFLHCVNSAVGPLRHLAISKRSHPEELFVELSRLAGALCTFSLDSHPASLPLYDHRHLSDCFALLDRHIRAHLELIVPSNCVSIPLESPAAYFWQGPIQDERTLNRSRWILGLHCRIGEADLIERTPRLVKVCSREFVPKLVQRALPGLKLSHLSVPPPAITPKIDFQYFAIDKAGPCWDHLVKTREVGVYIPGELPDPTLELNVILES